MSTQNQTEILSRNTHETRSITLRATDHRQCFAQNTHRIIIRDETETDFIGWPDPTDPHNSPHWKPQTDLPLQYPKFAWEIAT